MALLELHTVSKHFGKLEALHGVDLKVPEGISFGLLGPNGAGKTTLLRLVTGILAPDSGSIRYKGKKVNQERIGYMPEERGLYRKMGVQEHLVYLARLKGMRGAEAKRRVTGWLERFDILDWAPRRIEDLSKGMQQQVQFVGTLLHDPELIILDEPFSGLDPVNSRRLAAEIRRLREEGKTVILSTHRMDQVQAFCRDIVLLHHGRIILSGNVDDIREEYKQHVYDVAFSGDTGSLTHPGFVVLEQNDDHLVVRLRDGFDGNGLLALLLERKVQIRSFAEILPSLNDIFIHLVSGKTEPLAHAWRPSAEGPFVPGSSISLPGNSSSPSHA